MRAKTLIALLAVLSCAAAVAGSAQANAPYYPWPDALPPAPTASNPQPGPLPGCKKPTIACVNRGLKRVTKLRDRLGCDHRAIFAATYVEMTKALRNTLNAHSPDFADRGWIIDIDVLFHDYYFQALDDDAHHRPVPGAWRIAMRTARRGDANATKDLLLAVNAHVQRDLPYVLATLGLREPDGTSRKQDWDDVNHVVNDAYLPIARTIAKRYDPSLRLTNPGTVIDNEAALQLFEAWREGAWRNAERLLNAPTPEARAEVEASIEANATATARKIAGALPEKRGYRHRRDAYCGSH